MQYKAEIVDTHRLNELLQQVYDTCLICPPPYDYNNKEYEGKECPDVDCTVCWKRYLNHTDNPASFAPTL